MACQGLIAGNVQENTINIQSVPVPHVKTRKHAVLQWKGQGGSESLPTFFRKKGGCGYLGSVRLIGGMQCCLHLNITNDTD